MDQHKNKSIIVSIVLAMGGTLASAQAADIQEEVKLARSAWLTLDHDV